MKSRRISPTKKYINARDLELDLLLNLAIFGRLFLGMSGITCKTCNTLKANDCFRIKKDGIGYYDNCSDCWRGEATEFWKTKSFKVCGSCDDADYHCGSLHAISTMSHLKHAVLVMKNPLLKSIESCERLPLAFQQCQALKLTMLKARFLAPLKIRSLTPRRVILHSV